jgi:hypothetical protein
MTSRNDWQLQGDWRFLLYNQDTYGLGTGTPLVQAGFSVNGWGETEPIPGAQPMKFNLVRIHQAALKQTIANLYLGGSVRYDRYFAIVDQALNLSVTPPVVTSHYAYSVIYGFDPAAYTLSGATIDALYDSRDSTLTGGSTPTPPLASSPPGSGAARRAPGSRARSAPTSASPTTCHETCWRSGCSPRESRAATSPT